MITHFQQAWRLLRRNPLYAVLNTIGLATGLTAGGLVLLLILNETSFDRFHKNRKQLFRVEFIQQSAQGTDRWASITAAVGPSLSANLPVIEGFTRLTGGYDGFFSNNNKLIQTKNIIYADSSFFDLFTFRLISGNPAHVLRHPRSIVLTAELAEKLFGNENPIGRTIRFNNTENLLVTGIAAKAPANSHIRFSALISFSTLYLDKSRAMDWNGGNQYYTWVKAKEGVKSEDLKKQAAFLVDAELNHRLKAVGAEMSLVFEPMKAVYLRNRAGEYEAGNLRLLLVLGTVAVVVLLIAGFNYTNLANAQALRRARETGIRKVLGWPRSKLTIFYMTEGLLLAWVAWFVSVILSGILREWFSSFMGREIALNTQPWYLPLTFAMATLAGIGAALWPALRMASFDPVLALKGGFASGRGRLHFSSAVIALQFFVTTVLLILTFTVYRQINHVADFDKGFDDSNILVVRLPAGADSSGMEAIKTHIRTIAFVEACALSDGLPGAGLTQNGYIPEGLKESHMFHVINTDTAIFRVLGIQTGKSIVGQISADRNAVVVNQALAGYLGWPEPEGKKLYRNDYCRVAGVIRNFNHASLHQAVKPLIITFDPQTGYNYLLIKISGASTERVHDALTGAWANVFPGEPFGGQLLREIINESYAEGQNFGQLIVGFSLVSILIALLGLIGISTYYSQLQQRQAAIHRLLGASRQDLLFRLNRPFIIAVGLAGVLAWPAGYYISLKWQGQFAYTPETAWWSFPLISLMLMVIGLGSLIYISFRNRGLSPATMLRTE